jgi:hypothetical protein
MLQVDTGNHSITGGIMKRFILAACLFALASTVPATAQEKNPFVFTQTKDGIVASYTTLILSGPYYLKASVDRATNAKNVRLDYILIQNLDKCTKAFQNVEIKWLIKGPDITMETHEHFSFDLRAREVLLDSRDIDIITQQLGEKKK